MGKENVDVLLFANDIMLIADSAESLQMNVKNFDETLTRWEMKMNLEVTEVMKVVTERGHCCVEVGDRRLISVEVVKFFEMMISEDGMIEEEVKQD